MKNSRTIILGAFAIAAVIFVNGCNCAKVPSSASSTIVQSLIVLTGATVHIPIPATPAALGIKEKTEVQLVKDGFPISESERIKISKDGDFEIPKVKFSDAGSYSVFVSGEHGRTESAPVHLSVYSLFEGQSNGGVLTAPIGDFSTGSGLTCCEGSFDRFRCYSLFYGPNASSQKRPFVNKGSTNLEVATCFSDNGAIDTCIKIQENWVPFKQVICSDDAICLSNPPKLSLCSTKLSDSTDSTRNSYRVTIFYKSASLGTNTTVTFRWYYHNPAPSGG